jgi:rRNA maturation endonuclease Nob1
MQIDRVHGCSECYECNKGFHTVKNGVKKCDECGGTVLFLQELMDYIAEQQAEIRSMKEIYE